MDSSRSSSGNLRVPKPCIYNYECVCGEKIKFQNDLKEHYFACEPMRKHYGDLFTVVVKMNHR